jgi:hypothetical protein
MNPIKHIALTIFAIATLQAQSPNYSLSIFLNVPTGNYAMTQYEEMVDGSKLIATETYDTGPGSAFGISFPMQHNLAMRVGLWATTTDGTSTIPREDKIYLKHSILGISGDFQFFVGDGNAYGHTRAYLTAGISYNFETFERSFYDLRNDPVPLDEDYISDKTDRLALTFGMGYTFGQDGIRLTTEMSYHVTISSKNFALGNQIPTNFFRIGFGFIF